MFPNLKEIKAQLYFERNQNLVDISLLNNFDLPKRLIIYFPPISAKITIENNPKLDICKNDFICKALSFYPDSVKISKNGIICNKEKLIQDCISKVQEHEDAPETPVYPNPFIDCININSSF